MKTRVGIFFGGKSVEHEISIITANQAICAINRDKYEIIPIYVSKEGKWLYGDVLLKLENYKNLDRLKAACKEVYMCPEFGDFHLYYKKNRFCGKQKVAADLQVAFLAFHGTNGEDGVFQGIMESIGIPFVGCDTLSSANGMDKIFMKMILKENHLPVLDCSWFTDYQFKSKQEEVLRDIEAKIAYPMIVKPANLGSSVGISKAADRNELIRAIENATQFSSRIMVERMIIHLKEINCSVLGDCDICEASPCEEPFKTDEILSYKDKYMGGGKSKGMASTQRELPAKLSEEVSEKIRALAKETFRCLSCNGVSRIDFMIDKDTDDIYVNEINTIPGALSFYLWEAAGINFENLVDKLIELAFKRDRNKKRKVETYDQNILSMNGMKLGKMK